ncbi:MAG: hypothetical protein R3C15_24260, partial [Thermoleophilia bacterium]
MRAFQGTAVLAVAMSLFVLGACASDEARRDAPVRESSDRGSAIPTGFVELGEVARRSGARYAPAAGASRARLEVGGRRAEISGDSRVAYVDGELVLMPAIPERVGSAVYIDERFARRLEGWADLARRTPPAPALTPAAAPAPAKPARRGLAGFRVVVDAGHGGKDPGALGGGLRE